MNKPIGGDAYANDDSSFAVDAVAGDASAQTRAFTEPLKNGARLPSHPSTTTQKIIKYGQVRDAHDNHPLTAGLHDTEVRSLMAGNRALDHLYRFSIKQIGDAKYIFHTRRRVVISCEVEDENG